MQPTHFHYRSVLWDPQIVDYLRPHCPLHSISTNFPLLVTFYQTEHSATASSDKVCFPSTKPPSPSVMLSCAVWFHPIPCVFPPSYPQCDTEALLDLSTGLSQSVSTLNLVPHVTSCSWLSATWNVPDMFYECIK